jgi:hypothetical protein
MDYTENINRIDRQNVGVLNAKIVTERVRLRFNVLKCWEIILLTVLNGLKVALLH